MNEFEKIGLKGKDKQYADLMDRLDKIIELLEGLGRVRPG